MLSQYCAGGPTVLFTGRNARLADHAGQISFPGGKIDAGDANPAMAALREAEEESGSTAASLSQSAISTSI